jgi:hypothetical protein
MLADKRESRRSNGPLEGWEVSPRAGGLWVFTPWRQATAPRAINLLANWRYAPPRPDGRERCA